MGDQELTCAEHLSFSTDLLLSDPPYIVRSDREDANSRYGLLTTGSMADGVALCKREMRPSSHGHLFCCALRLGQWYKMISITRDKEKRESVGGEGIMTQEGEDKKKTDFGVGGVPLHYMREAQNVIISILISKGYHVNLFE